MSGSSKKNVEAIHPTSRQQKGMLFETLSATRPGIHLERVACTLRGPLDPEAFERAWQEIAARHSTFRTAFAWKGQEDPLQVTFERVRVPIAYRDLRAQPPEERQAAFADLLAADLDEGFDMSRPPLMRLHLLRTGEHEHRLLWIHHHILMDGWCRPIVLRDFVALYQAALRGEPASLPPARPYRDYIQWLRRKEDELPQVEAFWRGDLRGFTRPTPVGRPAEPLAARPTARHGVREIALDEGASAVLRSARGRRLTPSTVVQGLWALLLAHYAGAREVVFGTTVSGRPEEIEGVEQIVGLFINTLPFRLEVPPDARAWSWLQEVQRRHLDLRRYEHVSTGQIHQWSDVPGDQPLYESLLVYENYPADAGAGGGASELVLEPDQDGSSGAITRFALTLVAVETSRLAITLIHDRRRLEDADAGLIGEHLAHLLAALEREPDPLLADLVARLPAGEAPRFRALAAEGARPFVAPRTPTEAALAEIWQGILRVPEVSVLDDFLNLGGHSLMASEILTRVNRSFQVNLPLLQLYETPTLEGMAAAVVQAQTEQADPEVLARLLDELEASGVRR